MTKLIIANSCGDSSSLPLASSVLPAATSVFLDAPMRVAMAHKIIPEGEDTFGIKYTFEMIVLRFLYFVFFQKRTL